MGSEELQLQQAQQQQAQEQPQNSSSTDEAEVVTGRDVPQLQQQQAPQQPMPGTPEAAAADDRVARTREMLHGNAQYIRENAELIRDLLAYDPDPARGQAPRGIHKLIDARLPLWGILSAGGALAMVLITMWFNVQQLTTSVTDMQRIMRESSNSSNANDRLITRLESENKQLEENIRDNRARLDNIQNQINQISARLNVRDKP